jgi:hypothetical protein
MQVEDHAVQVIIVGGTLRTLPPLGDTSNDALEVQEFISNARSQLA